MAYVPSMDIGMPAMDEPLDPVYFSTDGFPEYGDLVTVRAAAEALLGFADALESITKQLSTKDPAVAWVIQEAETGSFVVDIEPRAQTRSGPDVADETVRLYTLAVAAANHGEDPAELVPKRAAEAIVRTKNQVESGALRPIQVRRGPYEAEFVPSAQVRSDRRKRQSIGSIEGELTTISFSGSPYFTVRTRLDGISVRCAFDPDQFFDEVVINLRKRVAVSGLVTKGADGIPRAMSRVERIYPFPLRDQLPQVHDVQGSDPELIEGMSSEEWVRMRRG